MSGQIPLLPENLQESLLELRTKTLSSMAYYADRLSAEFRSQYNIFTTEEAGESTAAMGKSIKYTDPRGGSVEGSTGRCPAPLYFNKLRTLERELECVERILNLPDPELFPVRIDEESYLGKAIGNPDELPKTPHIETIKRALADFVKLCISVSEQSEQTARDFYEKNKSDLQSYYQQLGGDDLEKAAHQLITTELETKLRFLGIDATKAKNAGHISDPSEIRTQIHLLNGAFPPPRKIGP